MDSLVRLDHEPKLSSRFKLNLDYVIMGTQTAQNPELSHSTMSKCSVVKDPFDHLDGHDLARLFRVASLNHHRSCSITNYTLHIKPLTLL